MPHNFTIPGLDYCYCDKCHDWIIQPDEIRRLNAEISKAKNPAALHILLSTEKKKLNQCP